MTELCCQAVEISLGNLTPADDYFGRRQTVLLQKERIKRKTSERRRLQHKIQAA
jgi:putative transposase